MELAPVVQHGTHETPRRRRSVAILLLLWSVLHLGCLFSPGLLDDVDSVYIEVAREMILRHDYVTPYVDGVRFFDKPPLMYWMAAGSMRLFGPYDWAARLPLSLCVLGLLFAVYALGSRLFGERGGFFAALAMGTSLGPYLFTRFYIPDIVNALWMTLAVHLFLIALDRVRQQRSALTPALWFSVVMALNLLTKGLIGIVFPVGFVVVYAMATRQWRRLGRMHLLLSGTVFCAVALPWHVAVALRNPAVAIPAGNGLPAHAGWFWFYIVNEHFMRFVGRRIPHDYGQLPVPLFWGMFALWLMPWAIFLPAAFTTYREVWHARTAAAFRRKEAALALLVWAGLVLGFFTFSSRQEYYSLPALPALALMAGGAMSAAVLGDTRARRSMLRCMEWLLLPLSVIAALVCGVLGLTSSPARPGTDLATVLSSNPAQYTLALGHLHDLTAPAMSFFRAPLLCVALGLVIIGPVVWWLLRRGQHTRAYLAMAAGMTVVLLCVHSGLERFYPVIGSKGIAQQVAAVIQPGDGLWLDGELVVGSTMLFYTQHPMVLVNGHENGPWFGSFWPDTPDIFADNAKLRAAWSGPQRIFLLTFSPGREGELGKLAPTHVFAVSGSKTILVNR